MTLLSEMVGRLLTICALVAALSGCENDASPPDEENRRQGIPFRKDGELAFLRDGGLVTEIDVEIAETDSARQRGLMQRESLPDRSGMLFIFEDEQRQSFWMANTPIALDILFVAADSQIVDVAKYTRPFSPQSIASNAPARFVVEVPAGFTDRHGISESDRVRWVRE